MQGRVIIALEISSLAIELASDVRSREADPALSHEGSALGVGLQKYIPADLGAVA